MTATTLHMAAAWFLKTTTMYNILQARIEYKDGKLERITVLVEMSKGDVRAIYATSKPRNGYMFLLPSYTVSEELLQKVAGYGMETVDRDKIFPHWSKAPISYL